MGDATGISWTDATWNPIRGCSRVSAGCVNCYAEQQAARTNRQAAGLGRVGPYDGLVRLVERDVRQIKIVDGEPTGDFRTVKRTEARWTGVVREVPEHLEDPLRWKRPRRIFVNSMSDLFHESLPDEAIDRVLAVMLLAPHHTFQVLTKRAARMRAYMSSPELYQRVLDAAGKLRDRRPQLNQIAIDNPTTCAKPWIWLGVSVENQAAADERIPELLRTPAAIRFLSCEPLLGHVDIARFLRCPSCGYAPSDAREHLDHHLCNGPGPRLHWVIVGCESGPGARPCDVEWIRSLRDQCAAAGVPIFVKQAVEIVTTRAVYPGTGADRVTTIEIGHGDGSKRKPGGVIELPYLDGSQHAAFPEVRRG